LSPYPLCDRCWTSRFSIQYIAGNEIPFRDLHKNNLKKMRLWKEDGESNQDWINRCKNQAKKNGGFFK